MNWITAAEGETGVSLRPHVDGQAVGPCPHCKHGQDRFVVFVEGNYWCRACGSKGWWSNARPTKEDIERIREDKKLNQIKLYTHMSHCTDWIKYHEEVGDAIELWSEHGIAIDSIMKWGLGYCRSAPLAPDKESLTIPVFHRGKLVDIRHRLIGEVDGNKYRSHMAGLTPPFFNLDAVASGKRLYVVEGEKKAISLMSVGIEPTVSYPGIGFAGTINTILSGESSSVKQDIVFIPDPGDITKIEQAAESLSSMGHRCYILDLFDKPDDFLREYGINNMHGALKMVRRIGNSLVGRR